MDKTYKHKIGDLIEYDEKVSILPLGENDIPIWWFPLEWKEMWPSVGIAMIVGYTTHLRAWASSTIAKRRSKYEAEEAGEKPRPIMILNGVEFNQIEQKMEGLTVLIGDKKYFIELNEQISASAMFGL